MKFSTGLIAFAAAIGFEAAFAAPLAARETAISDGDILNYALTLEHLEDAFYKQGLHMFSEDAFLAAGFSEDFYKNLVIISNDEATHVDFLQKGLTAAGAVPVKPCTYNFPITDVHSFVLLSGVLEGVGVSAYLGAAASILDKLTLTAAGSILTVEARHSTYIRAANHQAPFPQPFDTPLSFNQVFSLAVQFIKECPADQPPLPFKAFPVLTLVSDAGAPTIKAGRAITLSTPAVNIHDHGHIYAAFITVTGPIFVPVHTVDNKLQVTVPEGVNGQSYVVLTTDNYVVSDDNTIAGPAIVEIANF